MDLVPVEIRDVKPEGSIVEFEDSVLDVFVKVCYTYSGITISADIDCALTSSSHRPG